MMTVAVISLEGEFIELAELQKLADAEPRELGAASRIDPT